MKRYIHLMYLVIASLYGNLVFSQSCGVNITGGNCTGNLLTANFTGGDLAQITWKQNSSVIFIADTVSSTTSISLVAAGRGDGSASNQFKFPTGGMALDAAGNIFVADYGNNRIQKWVPGATEGVTVAGGNGAGAASNQLFHPKDVFVAANQDIYIADYGNHRIQKWSPGATEGVTVAGGNGAGKSAQQLHGPSGIYVDAQLNMYIADTYNYRIQRWNKNAQTGFTVAGGSYGAGNSQLLWPIDVYLDASKNIYIADADVENSDNHRIQKWALGATSGVTVAGGTGTGSGPNQFGYLLAITVDAAGNLYAADNGISGTPQSRIQKWARGAVNGVTVAGGFNRFWDKLTYPTGVAVDNSGNIFVLDGASNSRVQRYIPTNGIAANTLNPLQPGNYTAQAISKNGCEATSNMAVVRAIPAKQSIHPIVRGGRGNLCGGGIDTFYVNIWDEITTYTWTIPSQCSVIANKNDTIILSVPENFSSGRLIVKGTNTCGTGIPDTLILQGKPVSPYLIIGPAQVAASQQNIQFRVIDKGFVYNWNVPAGATITSGQNTSGITVNWGAEGGIVSVNASNDCGTSKRAEKMVATSAGIIVATSPAIYQNAVLSTTASIAPNPVTDIMHVRINASKQAKYVILLQDISGKTILQQERILTSGTNDVVVDISKCTPGIYLLNLINTLQEKISLKLVKE